MRLYQSQGPRATMAQRGQNPHHNRSGVPVIQYIQFIADVSVGGDANTITFWSRDKHAKWLEPEERGSWVILHVGATAEDGTFKRSGSVRRVPITNVAYINELNPTPIAGKGKA
jgi:hypothetical protein